MTFPSTDEKHTIYAEIYTPKTEAPRAVIQLAHGMVDHAGRYKLLAEYLTGKGYIFAGHHHLGHGKSVSSPDEFGYFADKGGVNFLLRDMHRFNRYLRDEYAPLPVIVFGHSMGSFITRLYIERYPHSIKGAVIHGTAGKNPALPLGRILSKIIQKTHRQHHRSKLVHDLAFGASNSAFPKEGTRAWLSRDPELAEEMDEYIGFLFTASGYCDLFKMLAQCNRQDWYDHYPIRMPTLIMSGTADPVGGKNAKGPKEVCEGLVAAGCTDITLKLYDGARHELFRETNRDEVFADLGAWLDGVTDRLKNEN